MTSPVGKQISRVMACVITSPEEPAKSWSRTEGMEWVTSLLVATKRLSIKQSVDPESRREHISTLGIGSALREIKNPVAFSKRADALSRTGRAHLKSTQPSAGAG